MKNVQDIYPLSPLQESLLSHALANPSSSVGFQQSCVTLRGKLDASAFERAWRQVVDRNAIMKTAFLSQGLDKPLQVVRQKVELPFRFEDWGGLGSDVQEEKLQDYLQADLERGFEPSSAPLMRCALLRTAEDVHKFVWSYHHLILDGWCHSLILEEVQQLFMAMARGEEARLPSRPPFRNYIGWLTRQDMSAARSYWHRKLAGIGAPTPLVVDRLPSPAKRRGLPGNRTGLMAHGEVAKLRSLARQHQLTLNTVVLGAWALLLSRYSGSRSVVFGATVSGRPSEVPGIGEMIGMFINNLPVRVEIVPEARLIGWLQEFQKELAELRQYEHSPLEKVQEWSGLPWGMRLFDSLLTFENQPGSRGGPGGGEADAGPLAVEPVRDFQDTNYALNFLVAPDDRLSQTVFFDRRRLDPATIGRLLGHFRTLLEELVTRQKGRLQELGVLTKAEWHQLMSRSAEAAGLLLPAQAPRVEPRAFVLDESFQPVPAGVLGRISVTAAAPSEEMQRELGGQWGPSPLSRELGEYLLVSEELGRYLPDGSLERLGPAERVFSRRGRQVVPGEIEAALRRHPDILAAAVTEWEVTDREKHLMAYVVPEAGCTVQARELRAFLKESLPELMAPSTFLALDGLPTTPDGQLDWRGLPDPGKISGRLHNSFVAPRDALELEVARLWEELFDLRPIGVTESFFDLGGHSLLAVRLLALIRQRFGQDLPLSVLFEAGTVEALARKLRKASGPEAWSPLVPIQGGESKLPFFCVHPVGGNVLCYVPLARRLGPEQPFYGLQARPLDEAVASEEAIESMAQEYVRAMRQAQPQGPYHLGGWSFGGVVAFEMARQLLEMGQATDLLAIFDTMSPSLEQDASEADYVAQMAGLAREHAQNHGRSLDLSAEDLLGLDRERQLEVILESLREKNLVTPEIGIDWLRRFMAGHRARRQARLDYRPRPYGGKISLFRAEDVDPVYWSDLSQAGRKALEDPSLGWSELAAQPIEVFSVPGTHESMLFEPYVQRVVEKLKACLEESTSKWSGRAESRRARELARVSALSSE